jgi:rhamnogalacturonyl hydrolase YesR
LEELQSPGPIAVDTILELYVSKYQDFIQKHSDTTLFPRSYENDRPNLVSAEDWTSGFFPGILWYLYEYTGEDDLLNHARSWTNSLKEQSYNTSTYDIGFIINSSYGQGYRLTKEESYKEVLNTAAKSLASRYNDNIGCIKSLDGLRGYNFPVLIDNMVNLEVLFKSWQWYNNEEFYRIANEHALKTMEMQFRPDFSSFQVVDYDLDSWQPDFRGSFQGYADSSSWARGQAWGLYGFVMAFRETKDRVYLDQSVRIASYILGNANFPADCIPYWDFQAPDIPAAQRDASTAAILASAFIDLSTFQELQEREKYLMVAENIIKSLTSQGYIANRTENENFVLKHCIGNMRLNIEVDKPVIYADYYFLEALMKYKNLKR